MLLVVVEKAVEGCGWETDGFGNEGGEGCGEGGHEAHVFFVGGAEGGEVGWVGPLGWRKEVVIEGCGRGRDGVGSGKVNLFAPVSAEAGYFVA